MASVTLKNVWKIYYNGIQAVTDFNLEIQDGEVIVLVGPSGCGKTTTLRMMAGLEEITKGELYIDDTLVNDVHPKDRGIAMVFQNYALFPHMTVFENIAFGLKPNDMSDAEIKEKVEEVAKILDVTHLLERKPKELSGGQKQLVALCRAFVRKNKVVMLDEPLSHLDVKLRGYMRTELNKLHQKFESTFIYVTHDQSEAMRIADRIVVMRDGFIQQVGTPEELYSHPCNLFVAGFLGTPQMYFLDTKVTEQDGDIYIDLCGVKIKLPEDKADKACAYIGKEIYFGIRPEDMYESVTGQIEATVEVREFVGDRIYLYCTNYPFSICVSPDCTAKRGDKIKLAVNSAKIHLFDKDTEITITN